MSNNFVGILPTELAVEQRLKCREVLFEGPVPPGLYMVSDGVIEYSLIDGATVYGIGFCPRGSIFGISWFDDSHLVIGNYYARCHSKEATVYRWSREDLLFLLKSRGDIGLAIIHELANQIRDLHYVRRFRKNGRIAEHVIAVYRSLRAVFGEHIPLTCEKLGALIDRTREQTNTSILNMPEIVRTSRGRRLAEDKLVNRKPAAQSRRSDNLRGGPAVPAEGRRSHLLDGR